MEKVDQVETFGGFMLFKDMEIKYTRGPGAGHPWVV